jgi:predicted pyridoxine 5'-phosphate oxidase superfamily flavin-nucleotide-binding protein
MRGYHDGEREVQRRAGGGATAKRLERGIRSAMPDVAREFLAGLRLLFAGSTDRAGRVWCSVLSGPPGFVATPDDRTVAVAARPAGHDPLAHALGAGPAPVGLLGIEPQTRRRIRVNGIAELVPDGLRVRTEQVYSNCPKYIARRDGGRLRRRVPPRRLARLRRRAGRAPPELPGLRRQHDVHDARQHRREPARACCSSTGRPAPRSSSPAARPSTGRLSGRPPSPAPSASSTSPSST